MPGPETQFAPDPTKTRPHTSPDFAMPNVTPPEQQQMVPTSHGMDTTDPLAGIEIPDDASALDPLTGDIIGSDRPTGVRLAEADPQTLRIVLAGLDKNIDQLAREAAHEKLALEKVRNGPIWKHITKRVWATLTHEYQVVKATVEAREEILKENNLRHHQGKSDVAWREAVVERMGSEFGEKLIHEEAGETYHKLGAEEAENDPKAKRIRNDTLDLVRRYAKGEIIDRPSFDAALDEVTDEWRKDDISQDYLGEGRLTANNMFAMAEQARAAFNANDGLDAIDQEFQLEVMLANAEIVVGEAKVGSNAEIKETLAERLAEKLKKVPFINESRLARVASLFTNEVFVAGMLSVALVAAKKATSVIPGLGAAVFAGVQERLTLKAERALAHRRGANDKEFDPTNKRQAEIEKTLYESRPVEELLEGLGALYNEHGELTINNRADLDRAIALQAEIRARIELGDRRGAQLISYADIDSEAMESRKFDLDLAMASLKLIWRSCLPTRSP